MFLAGRASPSQEPHSKTFPLVSIPEQNKLTCSDPCSWLKKSTQRAFFRISVRLLISRGRGWADSDGRPCRTWRDGQRRVVGDAGAPSHLRQWEAGPLSGPLVAHYGGGPGSLWHYPSHVSLSPWWCPSVPSVTCGVSSMEFVEYGVKAHTWKDFCLFRYFNFRGVWKSINDPLKGFRSN